MVILCVQAPNSLFKINYVVAWYVVEPRILNGTFLSELKIGDANLWVTDSMPSWLIYENESTFT